MKSVLMSIKPIWCELIANGKKTIEVRRTKPKIKTPFKVYIYCTIGDNPLVPPHLNCSRYDIHEQNGRKKWKGNYNNSDYAYINGKIIGEFICDTIISSNNDYYCGAFHGYNKLLDGSCLNLDELMEYGNLANMYGWGISNLIIYDKPKELSEFRQCHKCEYGPIARCNQHEFSCDGTYKMKRPPQSWCYVESV